MQNLEESETDEKKILERLDTELDQVIERLAGTEMDYDRALEAASLGETEGSFR